MKKLKIFLLLSILLCFGFALRSEVHAEDGNLDFKLFEKDEVLPMGKIVINVITTDMYSAGNIYSDNNNFLIISWNFHDMSLKILGEEKDFEPNSTDNYFTIDTSNWSLAERTISFSVATMVFWKPLIGYNITFEENGGSTIPDIEGVTELPISLPIPTKENHTFLGWYYNSAFTQIANPGDIIESDVTLYAKWELNAYKAFEVGDVLPAGYIKISWDFTGKPIAEGFIAAVSSSGDFIMQIKELEEEPIELYINYELFYVDTPGYTVITLTEPVTITSINFFPDDQGYDYDEYIGDALLWEVVSPEYLGDYDDLYDGELLEIEEDYILPAAKIGIKLLYNNTGGSKTGSITYTFGTYGQIILTAQEDNSSTQITSAGITFNFLHPTSWEDLIMIDDTLANQSFGSTRGILFAGVLLDFTLVPVEERTITDITVEGDLDIDAIFTRILTEEELAYQEGYSNGYRAAREIFGWKDGEYWYNGIDAWNLGEKYARELYGFYDSTTDEWLSVEEYLELYGTDKPGQSDFYNNFDKYFIPAMIIVFGGAIVLTVLKVFKGRE